jgi:hypothetical protein
MHIYKGHDFYESQKYKVSSSAVPFRSTLTSRNIASGTLLNMSQNFVCLYFQLTSVSLSLISDVITTPRSCARSKYISIAKNSQNEFGFLQ